MVWIQFQRFFIKFNTSTRISLVGKWIIALGCYFLQAERAESETEPKLKLKLAHIQNIQRRTLNYEWKWEWIIWNVQMLFAKCAKKKRNLKKDLGISPSLSPSHVFNKYHNEEVKRQQQQQQLKHLALSWCHLPPALFFCSCCCCCCLKETPSSATKVSANPNSRQAVGQAKQSALNCTVW